MPNIGAKILDNIDPNPENFVCAGILHSQAAQIGTLIRLEPNKQAKVCPQYFVFYLYYNCDIYKETYNKIGDKLFFKEPNHSQNIVSLSSRL